MRKLIFLGWIGIWCIGVSSCHGGGGPPILPPGKVNLLQLLAFVNSILVDWEDYGTKDFLGYNLYRATSPEGTWQKIASLLKASEYEDTNVLQGISYYYRVTVVNQRGVEGQPSNVLSAQLKAESEPPSEPRNLRTSAGDGRVYLEWNANTESDMAFYRIYRNTFNSVPTTEKYLIATVAHPQNTYLDLNVINNQTYYYVVTAVDTSGNESGPSNMSLPTTPFPDTIPPETSLLPPLPEPYTQTTSASFSFESNEAGSVFSYRLDAGDWSNWTTTTTVNYANLSEGTHIFEVRAKDLSGNIDPSPAQHTWNVDLTPPTVNLTQTPPPITNQNFANFAWSYNDASPIAEIKCHFVGEPDFRACTTSSSDQLTNLPEGLQTWHLRITDVAGNQTQVEFQWTTDYTPPETNIDQAPDRYTKQTSLTFEYSSPESPTTFECRLTPVELDFATCPSGSAGSKTYVDVAEGNYGFEVRAKDAAGNVDPTPASAQVTVDTTPPTISNIQGPPPLSNSNQANFTFTVQDNLSPISDVLCHLQGVDADFRPCTSFSSDSIGNVPEGQNTWHIKARDSAGNESAVWEYSWTTDYTAPGATIVDKPPLFTNQNTAQFTYQSENGTASFECYLSPIEANFADCPLTGKTYTNLTEGTYRFQVRAKDPAGNIGAPDVYDFTVDTTAPVVQIDSRDPAGDFINQTTVTMRFSGADNLSPFKFQCHLVGRDPAFRDCTSPDILSGLSEGLWTWHLRGVDEAGNVSAQIEEQWTVDTTPPAVIITSGPDEGSFSNTPQPTFTFSSTELSTFECTVDNNPPVDCSASFSENSEYTTDPLADGPHTFVVVATDQAGNSSDPNDPSARRNWTVDTTPPTVTVIQPNGGEILIPGQPYEIQWDASDNFGIDTQNIFLSDDSGATWNPLIVGLPGADRSYIWYVPSDLTGTTFRVMVQSIDLATNMGEDSSEGDFMIDPPPEINFVAPVADEHIAGGSQYEIQWTSSDIGSGLASHSGLAYSQDGGISWTDIPESECPGYTAPTAQSCTWNVPVSVYTADPLAMLQLTATDNAGNSTTAFTELFFFDDVIPPSTTVIAPNGGEEVDAPSSYTIEWQATDNVGLAGCDIFLSTDGGATYPTTIATNVPCSTYAWNVDPDLFSRQARIRVVARDFAGNTGSDDSDNNFFIVFYERWENPANPSEFMETHPTTALRRWWQFIFGGDANCPGPPANPYRWFFADDNVFGAPQGNHSQNWFRWDVCQNDPNYFYPPGDLLGLVAGPFDFGDASEGTLKHNSQWVFDTQDIGRLLVSAPLANPTDPCNTASTYYIFDHITGTSPNFGSAFESLTVDLGTISTPEGPVLGSTRCLGFITWDVDGDGDGGEGFGWFIDDIRVIKK